jgi:predicted hotdog family 3-hydroxylacyl-ACP dehydratase
MKRSSRRDTDNKSTTSAAKVLQLQVYGYCACTKLPHTTHLLLLQDVRLLQRALCGTLQCSIAISYIQPQQSLKQQLLHCLELEAQALAHFKAKHLKNALVGNCLH